MSVLTFNCVRAGCLQAIEVIKVMLCPDIAVRITAHAAIRKENNLRRIYDDVDVEVVEVEVVEEENISKKRKVDESDETKESNAENKEETLNRNDKTNESANGTENESSSRGGVIKSRNFAPLINRQVLFDATEGEFHNFNLPPLNPSCAVCGPQSTIFNMDDCAKDLDSHLQRVYQVINIILILIIYDCFYYKSYFCSNFNDSFLFCSFEFYSITQLFTTLIFFFMVIFCYSYFISLCTYIYLPVR